jgi:hypothetical protein
VVILADYAESDQIEIVFIARGETQKSNYSFRLKSSLTKMKSTLSSIVSNDPNNRKTRLSYLCDKNDIEELFRKMHYYFPFIWCRCTRISTLYPDNAVLCIYRFD